MVPNDQERWTETGRNWYRSLAVVRSVRFGLSNDPTVM